MNLQEIINTENKKDSPIVILDSGMGGLNILKKLKDKYPVENFLFICDNEMLPLGNKNKTVINRRVNKICKLLKPINPKSIIIACNTIDSISYSTIDAQFPSTPIYSVILPTIEKALQMTKTNNVALLATKNTIESMSYIKYALLKSNIHIYGVECLELAKAIENKENIDNILNKEIKPLENIEFDTLILGCTHYSLIIDKIIKKFNNKTIIDSSNELLIDFDNKFKDTIKNKANKQVINILISKDDDTLKENIKNILANNCHINTIKL